MSCVVGRGALCPTGRMRQADVGEGSLGELREKGALLPWLGASGSIPFQDRAPESPEIVTCVLKRLGGT